MKLDKRHEGCDDYYLFSAAEEGSLTCIKCGRTITYEELVQTSLNADQ